MKYARRRLEKSNVEAFCNSQTKTHHQLSSNVGTIQTVQHSQVTLGPLLGQGSFSSVYSVKGIDSDSGSGSGQEEQHDQTVVVKVLRKRLLDKPAMLAACAADLVKEGLLLASCGRHNNIVSIYGWTPTLLDGFRNGHHDAFFLLLEKLDYTLSDQLDTYWRKQYEYKTVTGAEDDSNQKRKKHSWRRPWNLKKQSTTTTVSLLDDDEEDDFFSTSSTSCVLFLQEHAKHLKFWHTRLRLAIDIATAIEFLHTKRILHRDIKVRS
jgi:serine/threonine protein kinase